MSEDHAHIKPDSFRWRSFFICLFLALSTLSVYLQVVNFDFVNLDDDRYIYENHHVQDGLTLKSIAWSFSFTDKDQYQTYWHPLTWLSHILDFQIYGLNPGMHHLTSLIIHILNSILLFLAFTRMTGEFWKGAIVAVLFALHPINVDSVAWVAERKSVLSTFFLMLTMLAYALYCEKPGISRYLVICLLFILGLLAKSTIVTLPCVLLLLDYWPLNRIRNLSVSAVYHMIVEKLPLFLLSAVSIYLSTTSLRASNVQIISMEQRPMTLRIANALVSYVSYIGKLIWPQNLAVHYPYPSSIPFWKTICAGVLLALISLFVFLALRRKPYLSVGWLWFIGTLFPAIGLMQIGLWPAMADRWAYVPAIGLLLMICWGVPEVLSKWRYGTKFLTALSLAVVSILIPVTWKQVQHWTNSISLFQHNLDVADHSYLAHSNLGFALANQGRTDEADIHYHKALQLNPADSYTHNNLGISLANKNRMDEAIKHFRQALRLNPKFATAHNNLGQALALQGKTDEAISHFKKALEINPVFLNAHYNLGNSLLNQGKIDEAIRHFSEALRINPAIGEIHIALGAAFSIQGNNEKAIGYFNEAIKIDPHNAIPYKNMGDIMRRQGKILEAIAHYNKALKLNPDFKKAQHSLGEAYFVMGSILLGKEKISEAVDYLEKTLQINNNFAESHIHLGYALLAQGKEDEAEKHFYEAIRIDPEKSINAYYNLACIYARRNRVSESIDWLRKAVDKGFNDCDTLETDKDMENIRRSRYYLELINSMSKE